MGTDQRIRGHVLVARCCYGVCLGFGFVVTTLTLAAMFWIVWCYFGLTVIHFSDTQRRAIVNYSYTTAKPTTSSITPQPDVPESSVNQISRFATASSSFQRNESPSTTEKRKELVNERVLSLAKGDFAVRERNNKTVEHDLTQKSSSSNETHRNGTTVLDLRKEPKETPNSEIQPILTREVVQVRRVSSSSPSDQTSDEKIRSTRRREDSPDPRISTANNDGRSQSKDERRIEKTISSEKDSPRSIVSSAGRTEDDSAYIDPAFIRENSRIPSLDDTRRGYDVRDTPGRDRGRIDDERLPKGDTRVLPDMEPMPRDRPRTSYEDRYRDRVSHDDRYHDSNLGKRRGEDDKYDDRLVRDDGYKDRRRDDDRYLGDRRERGDKYDEISVQEDKFRDRVRDDDRYSKERRNNDDRYYDSLVREGRYRYRDSDRDIYSEERRRRYNDTYDDRPIREERYRDEVLDDDRYVERYPDDRRRQREEYDGRRVRGDGDRRSQDDSYLGRNPEERSRKRDQEKSDIVPVKEDRYRDRIPDERYITEARRRIGDDKYGERPYDDSTRDREDRSRYRNSARDERVGSERDRSSDDERYRSRDRDSVKHEDRITEPRRDESFSRYDPKEDRYRLRDNGDRSRDELRQRGRDTDSLISSRTDYGPISETAIRDHSTRNVRRDSTRDIPVKEYSRSDTRDGMMDSRKDVATEDRYRSGYRDDEYAKPSRYNDRDRISPSRVKDDAYVSPDQRGETYVSRTRSYNDRRRDDVAYLDDRSSALVRNTKYQDGNDRSKTPTKIESSIDVSDDRREFHPKASDKSGDNTRDAREEVILDRRSYISEEDGYGESPTRSRPSTSSRNRDSVSFDRDYRYEDSRSKSGDDAEEYRQSRRTEYIPNNRNKDPLNRDRDTRYDKEDDINVRNRDISDRNRDRYDRSRDSYREGDIRSDPDRFDRNKDRYDYDRYDDRYEPRGDRYPPPDDEIRNREPSRTVIRDPAREEVPDIRNTRYPERSGDIPSRSMDTSLNSKDDRSYEASQSPSTRIRNESPSRSVRRKDALFVSAESRIGSRVPLDTDVVEKFIPESLPASSDNNRRSSSRDSLRNIDYEADQPLSAKDVIEAALRHSEDPDQNARKVFYPVFDPRISNLTSPDIIRPSERRGTTITAKKRRKREIRK